MRSSEAEPRAGLRRSLARSCLGRVALAAMFLIGPASAEAADAVLYRIFLLDGSTLVSYGDFARVAGRVVFSIPIGGLEAQAPRLRLVSIEESTVDWERTSRYAESARARHYAETRGEADFSQLSAQVAGALNEVAQTNDPKKRLARADEARRLLAEWPARNYGYRANDVAQLTTLLDEVVSELRVAAGESRFDLSLVATAEAPSPVPTLPPPSLRESIEQAFRIVRVSREAPERVALLRDILDALGSSSGEGWEAALRARASSDLAAELKTDRAYSALVSRVLREADKRARQADVQGIDALIEDVLEADDRFGRRRPHATSALLATLNTRLEKARRLRLARDAWTSRLDALRSYERRTRRAIEDLEDSAGWLEEIRQLAGPSPRSLGRLAERTKRGGRDLSGLKPPVELQAVHGMIVNAVHMADRAATLRQAAVKTTNMQTAWEASSAAAGALLLFERARQELKRLLQPPRL